MHMPRHARRMFLKGAGSSLLACGCAIGLPGRPAAAADACSAQTARSQAAMTPAAALQRLRDGNARFVAGRPLGCNLMAQVRATESGQYPFAAIVGCIDSRVSSALIFDHGIGDVFSAQVAGNFVNDDMLGSLEFACAVAGARLVVVLGHSDCGAIKGACDDVVLGNLTGALANLKPAVAAVQGFEEDRSSANARFVQAVAERNVALTVERIRERSPILRDMAARRAIAIVGAMHDVRTGVTTFT